MAKSKASWESPESLQAEIDYRAREGFHPTTIEAMEAMLNEIGYTLERSRDCRGPSAYLTGSEKGRMYPKLHTGVSERDTGLHFSHVDARRDRNFERLQEIRVSEGVFAVVGGCIFSF